MLSHWADTNGFKFSSSKTVCMHFCRLRSAHPNPELTLNGTLIPVVEQTKFLGVIFDNKLTFLPHICYLKEKCVKALNLLRVVAHTSWEPTSTRSYIFTVSVSRLSIPATRPWLLKHPIIDLSLHSSDKAVTPPEVFKVRFYELCDRFKNFYHIYTDGSKIRHRVSAALCHKRGTSAIRLPGATSIFNAELQ